MTVKIGGKYFIAAQAIEVVRENNVPRQRVESGFDVSDHIEHLPLQLKLQIILFDREVIGNTIWRITSTDGDIEATPDNTYDEYAEDAYNHLKAIYENKELVEVDCSRYSNKYEPFSANTSGMIYENMAMTHLGQVVEIGNVYYCEILFTEITKTQIATEVLYVQEMTIEDGAEVPHLRWSRTPFEPTTTEGATVVNESENPPGCMAISPDGQKVTSKNSLDDIMNWVSGIKEGIDGSLVFLIEP